MQLVNVTIGGMFGTAQLLPTKNGVCMASDPMDPKGARIATLEAEVHALHFCNASYWKQGPAASLSARAEYRRRLGRLEEIRRELSQLRPPNGQKKI
jgi:hypothetical protein